MIKRIELENFKCHRRFEEDLNQITILTGGNAAGKSSVVQAILLAVKSYQNIDKHYVKSNDVCGLNLGLPITIISENFDDGIIKIGIRISDKDISMCDHEVWLRLNEMEETSFEICRCEEMLQALEGSSSILKQNIYYINAERTGPRIVYHMDNDRNDYVGAFGEYTGYVINETDKEQRLNANFSLPVALKISSINRFSANCEEWLRTIIPGTSLQYSVDMEKDMSMLKFQNDGEFYLPPATGFGISYVLPIIVQGLLASMKENAVLLVENPEAHLHPYSQSAIGKFLAYMAACGVQVIVETHSEHVIDGCRLQLAYQGKCDFMKTIFFSKSNQESVYREIRTKESGELEEWPEGFFDQKRLDLRELLELRRKCTK